MKRKLIILSVFACLPLSQVVSQGKEYKLDKTYEISPTGTIELTSDDANVYITGSDRKDVRVKVYYRVNTKGITFGEKDFEMEVTKDHGNLILKEHSYGSTGVFFGSVSEEYEITIYAPMGVSLDIRGDDDDYVIKSINGSITLDADDGDVDIRNCNGNHFEFSLDDGDLEMDSGGGFLYVKGDDADFIFRNGKFNEVNATLDDGDLLLETSLAENGDYTFRVDDGTIDMRVMDGGGDFEINHDDGRVLASDDFKRIKESESITILKLSNGNARVRIRTNDGRVRLSKL